MSDHIDRFVTDAGYAVAIVRAPSTVSTITRDQHALPDAPAHIMGCALIGSLLLGTRLKGP
ncbi:MAG: hypothetical protein ACYTF0_08085, partial [Planctomycetota bacterium]